MIHGLSSALYFGQQSSLQSSAQMILGHAREKPNIWQVLCSCMPSLQCSSARPVHQSDRSELGVVIFSLPSKPLGAVQLQRMQAKVNTTQLCHQVGVGSQKVWEWSAAKFPRGLVGNAFLVGTRKLSKAQIAQPRLKKTTTATPMNLSTKANRSVVVLKNVGAGVHG